MPTLSKVTFTANTYRAAATLYLADAFRLLDKEEYRWAHYVAGIAVECILRAHGMEADEFVGRHDLMDLAKKAGFLSLPRDDKYDEYRAELVETNQRWRSNQRFMTEEQLERYLSSLQFDNWVKGSRVKYSSRRMYELASSVVGLGVEKWTSKNK